ncbi:hypothetical protein ACRALDRAFT_1077639 [Sodiomyces alcalophilus JCM 7366]|uniref:uncharacterized protein n=1 Tax=Sodiomyces alcalophilus JCM 7366 TaxID=591952 RepID=UPI0039B3C63F
MASKMSAQAFLDMAKNRRTYYKLSSEIPISKERVQEIVNELMLHCPTPYNSQATRAVILFGDEHKKLWDIATEIMEPILAPKIGAEAVSARFNGFRDSAATVMFFIDTDAVKVMQETFAFIADKWPLWASQADGMMQYALWTALEAEGLGCNLQHYNPEVDDKVAAAFGIPAAWKLSAQLVLGGNPDPSELPEKTVVPLETRVKVLGA